MNNREIKGQLLSFIAALSGTQTMAVRAQQQGSYRSNSRGVSLAEGVFGGFEMRFLHSINWLQSPKFEVL